MTFPGLRRRIVLKWTVPISSDSPRDCAVDPESPRLVAEARAHVLRSDRQLELHVLSAPPKGHNT
jgi:hypothetical protein